MQADVSQDGEGEAMVARCVERFGGVEVLVNNADIYPMRQRVGFICPRLRLL